MCPVRHPSPSTKMPGVSTSTPARTPALDRFFQISARLEFTALLPLLFSPVRTLRTLTDEGL